MNENEIVEVNNKNISVITIDFLQNFYPAYLNTNDWLKDNCEKNPIELLDKYSFYTFNEFTLDNIENRFEYFFNKLQKLFTTIFSLKKNFCYGIHSVNGKPNIIIGIDNSDKTKGITEKVLLEGLLPGVKLENYSYKTKTSKNKDRISGCITGIPTMYSNGKLQKKDLSFLIRSLNGQDYCILTFCRPLSILEIQQKIESAIAIKDSAFAISKKTISEMNGSSSAESEGSHRDESNGDHSDSNRGLNANLGLPGLAAGAGAGAMLGSALLPFGGTVIGGIAGGLLGLIVGNQMNLNIGHSSGKTHNITEGLNRSITETITTNTTISNEIQNGFAIELMNLCESIIQRYKKGRNIGLWKATTCFSADSEIICNLIGGSIYSEISSTEANILPPISFNFNKTKNLICIPSNIHESNNILPTDSLVTSEELYGLCSVPTENVVGFNIKESKSFALNCINEKMSADLGQICEFDKPLENTIFGLNEEDLNKHTFVCGITGCGKTNTVKKILEDIKQPFMVIEPAKQEYRNIAKKENVKVYTLGRTEINSLSFNPFYVLPGVGLSQHIDYLKDLFCASFGMYGPMPYIVEKCIYKVYEKKGWNLTLGLHPLLINTKTNVDFFNYGKIKRYYSNKSHVYLFPTMSDLKEEVDYYVNNMPYEGELKGNIIGAINSRIDSLCVGSKGYIFNSNDSLDIENLLNQNVVIELEGLADDSDKAFALGLLIIFINEYRQIENTLESAKSLRHLLIIEEAHRLLKNVSSENNEYFGNSKGKAVEHFSNLIAEMRAFGQGVVVVEQIPSKLNPDVIKNTSNKIIHRIVAKDDQELMASSIGLRQKDAVYLGVSKVGYALCHKEGMPLPVIVKMDKAESNKILDISIQDKEAISKASYSALKSNFEKEIFLISIKTLLSLMVEEDVDLINNSLEEKIYSVEELAKRDNISFWLDVNLRDSIRDIIADDIVALLTYGIFSRKILISNDFVEEIHRFIKAPQRNSLNEIKKYLEDYYNNKLRNIAIDSINLLTYERKDDDSIENIIDDCLLVKNSSLNQDIRSKQKGIQ